MTETLANGYSSESTQRELSNGYQHDRVWMVFQNLRILVLWTKIVLALEGLKPVYFRDVFTGEREESHQRDEQSWMNLLANSPTPLRITALFSKGIPQTVKH